LEAKAGVAMSLTAQAAAIAHLTADNLRLERENKLLAAMLTIERERLGRFVAAMPVAKPSHRSLAEAQP
jgi:hypothetical protein